MADTDAQSVSLPGAGIKGAPVSVIQRGAALDAIETEISRQVDSGPSFHAADLLGFLQQQTAFHVVGYTPGSGCAWAVFTDGRTLMIPGNFDTSQPPAPIGGVRRLSAAIEMDTAAQGAATQRRASALSQDSPLVTRDQFRLVNMWQAFPLMDYPHVSEGWVDDDTLPRIGRIAAGLGCFLVDLGTENSWGMPRPRVCDVEGLKAVEGDGVFFLTGTGGFIEVGQETIHGICTLTPGRINGELNTEYENDLDTRTLIYALAPLAGNDWSSGVQTRLAFTPEFTRTYQWSFPKESVVFLNTTGGGLGDWMSRFEAAGASVVLGWTGSPHARTMLGAAQDFFELMFATNHLASSWPGVSAEPRMRPYGIDEIYSYLLKQGLIQGSDGGTSDRLELFQSFGAGFVNQIRPSIEYLLIDEGHNEMQIEGQFGDIYGTVRIGGETQTPSEPELAQVGDPRLTTFDELPATNWDPHLIKVRLPDAGSRQTGMVQVWLGNRYSNVAHLTHWTVTFRINRSVGGGALHRSATVEVSFRAFVSGYRLSPDQGLDRQWPFTGISNMKIGKVSWSASGSLEKNESGTTTKITWSGAGNFNQASNAESFALGGVMWVPLRRLECSLGMAVTNGLHIVTETTNSRGTTKTETAKTFQAAAPDAPPNAGLVITPMGPVPPSPLSLYFDHNWALEGGSMTSTDTSESVLGNNKCETQIAWQRAIPDFPPEQDRGGR